MTATAATQSLPRVIFDLLDRPGITLADLRVLKNSLTIPTALQADIAAAADVSIRQVIRSQHKLEAIGVLEIVSTWRYDHHEKRPKRRNSYESPKVTPMPPSATGNAPKVTSISVSEAKNGQNPPKNGQNSTKTPNVTLESDMFKHVVVDNKDVEIKNDDMVLQLLAWIDEPTRSSLASLPHVSSAYAQAYRDAYYTNDNQPDWVKDKIGWLIQKMRRKEPAPLQIALPAGTMSVSQRYIPSKYLNDLSDDQLAAIEVNKEIESPTIDNDPAEELWQDALIDLHGFMTKATYNALLNGSEAIALDGDCLIISVASERSVYWLDKNWLDKTVDILKLISGRDISVKFVTGSAAMQVSR